MFKVVSPNSGFIPACCGVKRIATRPLKYRDNDFDEKYDERTLFYDIYFSEDNTELRLNCPPFLNLQAEFREADFSLNGAKLSVEGDFTELDRCADITFSGIKQIHEERQNYLEIDIFLKMMRSKVGRNFSRQFAGKRVILAKSKNNNLKWIKDWCQYYAEVHGANAILFYDNGSEKYKPEDLLDVFSATKSFDTAVVVDWGFMFGPSGSGGHYYDSDYCQHAILQNARHRYLASANSVLSVDIDELILPATKKSLFGKRKDQSVFEVAEKSRKGYVEFSGEWIDNVIENARSGSEELSFCNFQFRNRNSPRCATKWCVVPRLCPPENQWKIHKIRGMVDREVHNLEMRHFKAISTNWKYHRSSIKHPTPDIHHKDERLVSLYSSIKNWN